ELRGILSHAGRLQYHAPGFPISSLEALRAEGAHDVALLDVDWEAVRQIEAEADALIDRGRRAEARVALERALALAAEQPKILRKLAQVELALGDRAAALDTLARFLALEPGDARMAELRTRVATASASGAAEVQ